jgi:hypothetical protein
MHISCMQDRVSLLAALLVLLLSHVLLHISPQPHEACDAPLQSINVPRDSQQPVAQLHVLLSRTRHTRDDGCLPLRLLVGVLAQLSQPGPAAHTARWQQLVYTRHSNGSSQDCL